MVYALAIAPLSPFLFNQQRFALFVQIAALGGDCSLRMTDEPISYLISIALKNQLKNKGPS
jgi:hypothetical protein